MAANRRRLLARRRRHDDAGDDEGSIAGIEEYSISDGSVSSLDDEEDPDGEGSEVSLEDVVDRTNGTSGATTRHQPIAGPSTTTVKESKTSSQKKRSEHPKPGGRLDPTGREPRAPRDSAQVPKIKAPTTQAIPREPQSDRKRKEDFDQMKRSTSDPTLAPVRGGFFLHDDRAASSPGHAPRTSAGRGRGYHGGGGKIQPSVAPSSTQGQWAHDLHETVNQPDTARATHVDLTQPGLTAPAKHTGPNRHFSTTHVLGNVKVQVKLPDSRDFRASSNVIKKHYTLLPEHRPPLRRDKPVRISIPDVHPRFIFPSIERSFVFIPRNLRPNQKPTPNGRGRGSFQGSRRPSVFGGSTYTPSLSMSRKSSITASATGSGIHTPTGIMSGHVKYAANTRPVVRMPGLNHFGGIGVPHGPPPTFQPPAIVQPELAPMIHSPSASLPMHQPRPQKTVSMAGIEPPGFRAPLQQHEEPFHQQMPPLVPHAEGRPTHSRPEAGIAETLGHLPEGAVFAQQFRPYSMIPPDGYYDLPFTPFFAPQPHGPADALSYGPPIGAPVGQAFPPPALADDSVRSGGPIAHESNGMVYYYHPSSLPAHDPAMHHFPPHPAGTMNNNPPFYPMAQHPMYFPPQAGQ